MNWSHRGIECSCSPIRTPRQKAQGLEEDCVACYLLRFTRRFWQPGPEREFRSSGSIQSSDKSRRILYSETNEPRIDPRHRGDFESASLSIQPTELLSVCTCGAAHRVSARARHRQFA